MLNVFSLLQLGHKNEHSTYTACPHRTDCILDEAEWSRSIHSISDSKNVVKMPYVICRVHKKIKMLKSMCVYKWFCQRVLHSVIHSSYLCRLGMSLGWDGGMDGNGGLNNTFLWQGDNCLPSNPFFSQKKKKKKEKWKRLLVAQRRHVTKCWASCRLVVVV